jgi:hypothetical protein
VKKRKNEQIYSENKCKPYEFVGKVVDVSIPALGTKNTNRSVDIKLARNLGYMANLIFGRHYSGNVFRWAHSTVSRKYLTATTQFRV